jgi:hypothetical protein
MSEASAKLAGYVILLVVLLACLFVMALFGISPWFDIAAVVLSVLSVLKFLNALSAVVVGFLVALVTVALPIAMLFAMGAQQGSSPLSSLDAVDVLRLSLPTVTAVLVVHLLKSRKGRVG